MSRSPQGNMAVGLVIVALIAISYVIFGVLLGPGKAYTIASSAAAMTLLDGYAEEPAPNRLPVVEVFMETKEYASVLKSDDGGEVNGTFTMGGNATAARFSFSGASTNHTKRSFQVRFDAPPNELPFRSIEVLNPVSADMLQEHMALWIAGEMGVGVPYDGLFVLRINDQDIGVMEIRELIGSDMEQARGLSRFPVAVSECDENAGFPTKDSLANIRAASLVNALNDQRLTAYARRDSIAMAVDVDAVLRYVAALEVLHMNNTEHCWVFGTRSGTFYPVMCRASIMEDDVEAIADSIAVAPLMQLYQVVEKEPEWRTRKEQLVRDAKAHLLENDLFLDKWRQAEARLIPSLLRDREKHTRIIVGDGNTYGYSIRRAVRTSATFRDKALAYWRGSETASP